MRTTLLYIKKKQKNNHIILNIIHNIFTYRDTEVVICMILVLLKKDDGLAHYQDISSYTRSSHDIIMK